MAMGIESCIKDLFGLVELTCLKTCTNIGIGCKCMFMIISNRIYER